MRKNYFMRSFLTRLFIAFFITNSVAQQHSNDTISTSKTETIESLEQVVITGTKTYKRKTDAAVIVGVINGKTLDNVQACTLSEGLKFQTGLRVETDCQTCNYTQLRINGLAGGYSQILINGRSVFSPLTGLYGLEQIPTNMIDRIEVVRGGGSALYGSSAIGGTVNVITKVPRKNNYSLEYTYQNFEKTNENSISGNATVVSDNLNQGASFFIHNRVRDYFDANNDQFSELPKLNNLSFGTNLFFLPHDNQKITLSLSKLHEYRYGGEMVDGPPHLALQSEERTHDVFVGSFDYELTFNNNSSFTAYASSQHTNRAHYTGVIPDQSEESAYQEHLENPPYGSSKNTTVQGGVQINYTIEDFIKGANVFTFGGEFVEDDVLDTIDAYSYSVDQVTQNYAGFLQSDWTLSPRFNLLSGLRLDKHNLVDKPIVSPRISLLYKPFKEAQFRATWGTGFRAPQAFDTDLHLAFAGGGISRILLSDTLKEERSNSYSTSINYDKGSERFIAGFTLEGFYTYLKDAFFLAPIAADEFGERYEKQNGDGATVKGVTLELRANFNKKVQLEAGYTLQSSLFNTAVQHSENLPAKRSFLRTPNTYGYTTVTLTPNKKFNSSMSLVYTGAMDLVHLAGAPEQTTDTYLVSDAFLALGLKTSYTFTSPYIATKFTLFAGVKNLLNHYQSDFDSGKNRDSNHVYGPAMPRTFFVGIRFGSGGL